MEKVQSGATSPIEGPVSQQQQQQQQPRQSERSSRANRAALRDYYKLRATIPHIQTPDSEVDPSELDAPDFDADAFTSKAVAEQGLEHLLRLYTRVLGEVRALDAEKKALVYDNYSKLITATETIRKMRENMDPLHPMASTLDPAIAQIYAKASSIRDAVRETVPPPDSDEARVRRQRQLAVEVTNAPARIRALVAQGKVDEAKRAWEMPRRLLDTWRARGVGGNDVQALIEEGDKALWQGEKRAEDKAKYTR